MSAANAFTPLPIPPHYDPDRVSQVWRVPYNDLAAKATAWANQHGIKPAAEDDLRVCLLLIDMQNTFCTPDFELYVGDSAIDDSRRICEFIYRHLGHITHIVATLDTHGTMQIFHPIFFIDENGNHPAPGSQITLEDLESGKWKANPAVAHSVTDGDVEALQQHLIHYARCLSDGGRYDLTVWPYHSMLGGIGHALVSAVEEACFFHNVARQSQMEFLLKGDHPLTEYYSAIRPEVMTSATGETIAERNSAFLQKLLSFDRIIIAGQAKSHCVAWTVDDLYEEIKAQDPSLAKKVYLLEDCTSPVIIPGVVDFTQVADEAFERFAAAGMHIVRSTDPIAEWPDFVR